MSIRSALNNTINSFKETMSSVLGRSKSSISSIVGTASTGINGIFSGGFVGMDEEGMEELYNELKKYIDELEEIIDSVTYYERLEDAYKGKIQETVIDYIESVKKLLRSYITTLRQEIEEAKEAYNNFVASAESISANATQDAEEIRSESEKIRL